MIITNINDSNYQNIGNASYLMFIQVMNGPESDAVKTIYIDAALGRYNSDTMHGIGKAFAMYGWYNGKTYNFSNLCSCNTLQECITNAGDDLLLCGGYAVLAKSTWGLEMFNASFYNETNVKKLKTNQAFADAVYENSGLIDGIRSNSSLLSIFNSNRVALVDRGVTTWTVPSSATAGFVTVQCIGGGGTSSTPYTCGGYKVGTVSCSPGDTISYSIGAAYNSTTFGGVTANAGADSGQSGAFITKGTNGGSYVPATYAQYASYVGHSGFGGGDSDGWSGKSVSGATGTKELGTGGAGGGYAFTWSACGYSWWTGYLAGGAGYGGGAGASGYYYYQLASGTPGQGAIAICW